LRYLCNSLDLIRLEDSEILFTFHPFPLQYHHDLETMDTMYRGR
jgi:hypothetical protein